MIEQILARAIANDPYDRGEGTDISVTQLISPPQMVELLRHHKPEKNLGDNVKALYGSIAHGVLERGAPEGALVEERFYMDVLGWRLSGQIDLYEVPTGTLTDFKFVSTWTKKFSDGAEHTRQLNIQAQLLRHNGYFPQRLVNSYIYRDWSGTKAKRDADYPPEAEDIERELMSDEDCFKMTRAMVFEHQQAAGGSVRPCTPSEQWHKPDTYAVMKEGRKSALRVLESKKEALQWALDTDKADFIGDLPEGVEFEDSIEFHGRISIVHRPGENTRCLEHCPARSVCPQIKE